MSLSILIQVTHLLGAGHLTRAAALAGACASRGHRVTLLSGGMPNAFARTEAFELIQLPPVRIAGTAFTSLLTSDGDPADAGFLARRREAVQEQVRLRQPDILVTELFPFGRRVLAEEFLMAIDAARTRREPVTVLSSIRDILAPPSRPQRAAETLTRIENHYDGVLVHGDPSLVPLEASWPVEDALKPFLTFTGYIDNPTANLPETGGDGTGEIIVSGGSSAASLPLYRAAVAAAGKIGHPWRILVGNGVGRDDFAALAAAAPANVIVEPARADFRSLLARASLSISLCGYNTAIDVLGLPLRRLFVPFEAGGETEQLLRAQILAARGLAYVLREGDLSAATLAASVEKLLASPVPALPGIRLDGAEASAVAMETIHERQRR